MISQLRQRVLQLCVLAVTFLPASSSATCSTPGQQSAGLSAVDGGSSTDVCSTDSAVKGTLLNKIGGIIDTLFIVAGAVAVIIIIMGGIRYITATGDSKRVQAAKDTILYAVIGLIVVILGRAIVGFVIGQVAST